MMCRFVNVKIYKCANVQICECADKKVK